MRRPAWGSRGADAGRSEWAAQRLDVLLPEDLGGWVPWQEPVLAARAQGRGVRRHVVDLHLDGGLLQLDDELPPLPHLRHPPEPVRRTEVALPPPLVARSGSEGPPGTRAVPGERAARIRGADPASVQDPPLDAPVLPTLDPASGDVGGLGSRWGFLPSTLRGGRVDPGRSGALALVAVAVVAALVAGVVLLRGRPEAVPAPEVLASGMPVPGSSAPTTGDGQVVVSVVGKVRRPGVVRLPLGARVDDAVRAAGGVSPGASAGLLNLARRLVDGEQVLVGIEAPPGTVGAAAAPGEGLVDLNTATTQQLEQLPGVGPVLAERIVAWRTEHGRFASVDQLREVSGIGESKYAGLKTKVRV